MNLTASSPSQNGSAVFGPIPTGVPADPMVGVPIGAVIVEPIGVEPIPAPEREEVEHG